MISKEDVLNIIYKINIDKETGEVLEQYEFDIEIANDAAESIVTVGDAVEQIKNALN